MELAATPGLISDIGTDDLRRYIETHDEVDYQLVDVRQPEEYRQGHIPGAQLLPLSELEARQNELLPLRDKKAIFYCRSGARSFRAASWASSTFGLPQVFNVSGGFMAWNGLALPDFPRLVVVDIRGGTEALLLQALNLEKGTHTLYELIAREYTAGAVAEVIGGLAKAEVAHGQLVHQLLTQVAEGKIEDFATMFDRAQGDLIESGESYEQVVARAKAMAGHGSAALLELALEIELTAYDLYKSLAAAAPTDESRRALADLAQQEKRHAEGVLKAIGRIAAES